MAQILILLCVTLFFYLKTIKYEFISDDISIAQRKPPDWRDAKNWWDRIYLEFRCKRYFKSKEVHFFAIVAHAINVILVYFLFGKTEVAFYTALLFAVNPVNSQAVAWCSGRSYSISTTFVLLMYLFPLVAPVFFYFTKFFSANAIFAPLAFVATPYWWWTFMPLGILFIMRKVLKEKSTTSVSIEMRALGLRKIITGIKTFGYYFTLCLFPFRLGWHHQFVWGIGVTQKYNDQCYSINKDFWKGLFVLYFVVTNLVFNFSNAMFGLLWFFVNILMWCNIITWQQQIAERFCYLACVGLMNVLVLNLFTIPFPYNYLVLGLFLGGYAVKLWLVIPMYANEYWRVEHTIIDQPNSHYIWIYRGFKKFHLQDYVGALYDFMEGQRHSPHEFKTNFNLASTFVMLQNIGEAKRFLKIAEENMYVGEESKLKPIVDNMWAFIKEVEETKQINVSKIVLFS